MGEITRAPTAAIIVIGDEVLSGKVEEQNARFLVRELRQLGVGVRRIEVIPDVPAEIIASVRRRTPACPRAGNPVPNPVHPGWSAVNLAPQVRDDSRPVRRAAIFPPG